ncbi:hypothetical protein E2562_032293 [Oryza meyeriana var. granulata]|uniref:Uncharacterized protein n=1 Tax=Oryza meyeriana var. granulata TaxID=110450 RepID=A0A6G1F0R5_9ORYZ|nr:hypothetical protein E2562_032293 [Oryza meyeriana var. granulata]
MDTETHEKIGGTGGVVSLLAMFLQPSVTNKGDAVRVEAGDALAMLAVESRRNFDALAPPPSPSSSMRSPTMPPVSSRLGS